MSDKSTTPRPMDEGAVAFFKSVKCMKCCHDKHEAGMCCFSVKGYNLVRGVEVEQEADCDCGGDHD